MGFFNFSPWKKEAPKTVENSNVENQETIEKKKNFLDYLSKWGNRTFLAGALFAGVTLASEKGYGPTWKSKEEFKKGQTEHTIEKTNTINIDAVERSTVQDSSGNIAFNPWGLVAPVQMSGKYETVTLDSAKTTLPYHWAETFREIQAAAPELRDSLHKQLVAELKQEISQSIYFGFFGSTTQEVDAFKKGGMRPEGTTWKPADIESLTIIGISSPEGRTRESIIPGNIDPENLDLAQNRANDISPFMKEALTELGLDTSKVKVEAKEIQFSQAEYNTIIDLAVKNGYMKSADATTAAYNFIKDYNHGAIKDSATVDQMKTILDGKRGVMIEVVTKGKESKEVAVPLPLLLFLMPQLFQGLAGINWQRKKDKEPDPLPPPTKKVREIFSEATIDRDVLDKEDKNFHDLYRNATETEGANYQDVSRISDLVYTQEIYPYINHADSIEKGLDYMLLVDNARHWRDLKPPHYKSDSEIKEKLAEYVLEDWQEYDRNVRKGVTTSSGPDRRDLTAEEIERTVEYRHDPSKVIWAIQAAEHIFELSNAKNDAELEKLMEKKRVAIEERRAVEVAGTPATEGKLQAEVEKDMAKEKAETEAARTQEINERLEKDAAEKGKIVSADNIATPIDEPKALPYNPIASEPVAPVAAAPAAVEPVVVEKKPRAPRKKIEKAPVDSGIPAGNLEPVNAYDQYKADNENLADMAGGFAQALSQENLQKMYAAREAEKEAQKKESAPQDRINVIDAQLQALEFQLNDKKLRKDEKAPIEAKFNELEQEKRKIQETL